MAPRDGKFKIYESGGVHFYSSSHISEILTFKIVDVQKVSQNHKVNYS